MKTISSIATESGVSRKTLYAWKRAGIDIMNPASLRARIDEMQLRVTHGEGVTHTHTDATQATPDSREAASRESYQEARRRREIATANRAETLAARERGEFVPREGIAQQGEAIGRAVRAGLDSLRHQLTPRLAGRTAAEVDEILRAEFRRLLSDLSDRASEQFFSIQES